MSESKAGDESLEAKIKAARERKAAADAKRDELPQDLEAELARAEREARDSEALLAAESKHGRTGQLDSKIAAVATDLGLVIVKRAETTVFKKFMDQESVTLESAEKLTRPCVIYPTREAFDRMCDDKPAILTDCAEAVCRLMGVRRKAQAGKS